jgi:hypothetical protein
MRRVRSEAAELPSECSEMRWDLCGLAVGLELGQRGVEIAGHVVRCPACDGFVDDLAEIRRSLGGGERPGDGAADRMRQRSHAALARELEARLARDLLAQAAGDALRPLPSRRRDVQRLDALRWASRVHAGPWDEVRRAILEHEPVQRGRILQLASLLDGSGLDVALAWLGFLVRSGQDDRAQGVADRLLAEVEP